MSKKYIIAEINETTDLTTILGTITENCRRFAVVNKVRGIFEDVNDNRRLLNTSADCERHCRENTTENCSDNLDASDSLQISDERDLRIRFNDSFDEKTHKKRSRERKGKSDEKKPQINTKLPEKITCGVCRATLKCRMSVALKKHVQRHLNISTVACGRCDFEGVLHDHIKKHTTLSHNKLPAIVKPLHLDEDYIEKYGKIWESCFKNLPLILPDIITDDTGNVSRESAEADNNVGEEEDFENSNNSADLGKKIPVPSLTSFTSFNNTLEDYQDAVENTDGLDAMENDDDNN